MPITQILAVLSRRTGLSHDDLAARLGVTRQTLSGWMRGRTQPRAAALRALADEAHAIIYVSPHGWGWTPAEEFEDDGADAGEVAS